VEEDDILEEFDPEEMLAVFGEGGIAERLEENIRVLFYFLSIVREAPEERLELSLETISLLLLSTKGSVPSLRSFGDSVGYINEMIKGHMMFAVGSDGETCACGAQKDQSHVTGCEVLRLRLIRHKIKNALEKFEPK